MRTRHRRSATGAFALVWLTIASVACQGSPPTLDVRGVLDMGETIYQQEGCVNCHGPEGTGDTGPDLSGLMNSFANCDSQVEWVSLGSARWARSRGSSYGDANKPVRGGMPGFGERLGEDQIRKVVSFTRAEFAGGDEDVVVRDCLGGR